MATMAQRKTSKSTLVFQDTKGNVVTDDASIVQAYRERAEEMELNISVLDDGQVAVLVKSVVGTDANDDTVQARLDKLAAALPQTHQDTQTTEDLAATARDAEAVTLGSKFDDAMAADFIELADAKEKFDGAPLILAEDMKRLGVNVTQLPRPGTKWNKIPPGYNGKPDWYSYEAATSETVRGQYYADAFDSSKAGEPMVLIRNILKKKPADITAEEHETIEEIAGEDDIANDNKRKAALSRWNQRRTSCINKLRRAVTYLQQVEAMKGLKDIRVQLIADEVHKSAQQKEPLQIIYTDMNGKTHPSRPLSLTTFNAIDVPKAKQAGGTLAALMATVARAPRTNDKQQSQREGLNIPSAPNARQAEVMLGALCDFFHDNSKGQADLVKRMLGPDSNDVVMSFGDMLDDAQAFFKPFSKRWQSLHDEQLNVIQQEAAAREAAKAAA